MSDWKSGQNTSPTYEWRTERKWTIFTFVGQLAKLGLCRYETWMELY